jgi:prefoldin subunit 5
MEKPNRSIEEIHQDYSRICSQAGHVQYQIAVLSKDLELLNSQLKDLNLEAAKVQAAKEAEAKASSGESK